VTGRYSVIDLATLGRMAVLETIDTEAVLNQRMAYLVTLWRQRDPPAGAVYDVAALEFDPIKINQEVATYYELMMRDRVNQAARAVTLAFATGSDLDAIATRYPGGVPRMEGESDDRYRHRIWAAPNPLSAHGTAESYEFWGLSALAELRDVTVTKIRPLLSEDPIIIITCMLEGANPTPSPAQLLEVRRYIIDEKRKGATDVVTIRAPIVKDIVYHICLWLYPGPDAPTVLAAVRASLAALVERQRWLGADHTLMAINAAVALAGVHSADIESPTADVRAAPTELVRVTAIEVEYRGRRE
jgi:phage-related baseplate assembly protein